MNLSVSATRTQEFTLELPGPDIISGMYRVTLIVSNSIEPLLEPNFVLATSCELFFYYGCNDADHADFCSFSVFYL